MEKYEPPKVEVVAELHELTLGNKNGNFTDKMFPNTTPKNELTFSG